MTLGEARAKTGKACDGDDARRAAVGVGALLAPLGRIFPSPAQLTARIRGRRGRGNARQATLVRVTPGCEIWVL